MVNLTHEDNLLQKINDLDANAKIQSSVGLTPRDAQLKIQKLIRTTRQRLNAAKFYLDSIGNIDYASCLRSQPSRLTEQKPPFVFSNSDFQGQINLLTPDALPSIVFLMLRDETLPSVQSLKLDSDTLPLITFLVFSGFFLHIVSTEDCLTKIINIVYNLAPYNKRYLGFDIREKLKNKIPNGQLIRHLRSFYSVIQKNNRVVENHKGSPFNIAKQIRNQLTHDDLTDIIDFPPTVTLSGFVADSDLKLYFHNSFFPTNTRREDIEVITFCHSVFKDTQEFIDECYKLILGKLRSRGHLPV